MILYLKISENNNDNYPLLKTTNKYVIIVDLLGGILNFIILNKL